MACLLVGVITAWNEQAKERQFRGLQKQQDDCAVTVKRNGEIVRCQAEDVMGEPLRDVGCVSICLLAAACVRACVQTRSLAFRHMAMHPHVQRVREQGGLALESSSPSRLIIATTIYHDTFIQRRDATLQSAT